MCWTLRRVFLKPTSSMKSGAFAENGKKEKYTEPLSSGKVYAVHLFVLVSSVKIFAHQPHWKPSIEKHFNAEKTDHTISPPEKKILPEETFTLSAVHTAKVSTKQDVCELYFFPGALNALRCLPGSDCRCRRSFDISTRIDLLESFPFSQPFHIFSLSLFCCFAHTETKKCWIRRAGKLRCYVIWFGWRRKTSMGQCTSNEDKTNRSQMFIIVKNKNFG